MNRSASGAFVALMLGPSQRSSLRARNATLPVNRNSSPKDPNLGWIHGELRRKGGRQKSDEATADASPRCSLFAGCQLDAQDSANEWHSKQGSEIRRQLRGYRSAKKFDAWMKDRGTFLERIYESAKQIGPVDWQFDSLKDFPDDDDEGRSGDSYLAYICLDGDGLGTLIREIDWNQAPVWTGDGMERNPWRRNRTFSEELDQVTHNAYRDALVEVIRSKAAQKYLPNIPALPHLLGGDDLWTVCRKDVAFDLCRSFTERLKEAIRSTTVLKQALSNRELTFSFGIAFAKAGYPAHALIDAAESLLSSAKGLREDRLSQPGHVPEACVDWYWIESSLVESVKEAQEAATIFRDGAETFHLTTRPWTVSQTEAFQKALEHFRTVPRRKREQLDEILRHTRLRSLLYWEGWTKRLLREERDAMAEVRSTLRSGAGIDLPAPMGDEWASGVVDFMPWIKRTNEGRPVFVTPLLDLLSLDDVMGAL